MGSSRSVPGRHPIYRQPTREASAPIVTPAARTPPQHPLSSVWVVWVWAVWVVSERVWVWVVWVACAPASSQLQCRCGAWASVGER
eukprot:scaffold64913_cov30-Phaeocystis_antarctica.AAC.1